MKRPTLSNVLARAFFLGWLVDEAICYHRRSDPPSAKMETNTPLIVLVSMGVPLLWATRLPRPLRWIGIAFQAISLIIMIGARRQLIAVDSFGWTSEAGMQVQRRGFYRFLEHPIYLAMQIHLLGWSLTNPIALAASLLSLNNTRAQIRSERAHLARIGATHRGIDSPLWDRVIEEA